MPPATSNRYCIINATLVGPLDATIPAPAWNDIPYYGANDWMVQAKGPYGENPVEHVKYEGSMAYVPACADTVLSPATGYPNRLLWKTKSNGTLTASRGAAWSQTPEFSTDTNGWTHYLSVMTSTGWIQYYVYAKKSVSATVPYAGHIKIYTVDKMTALQVTFKMQYLVVDPARPPYDLYNWSRPATMSQIIDYCTSVCTKEATPSVATVSWYQTYSSAAWSQSSAEGFIRDHVLPDLQETSSLQERHYGDLVLEASQKLNINHVNMIAFLRDIRHPSEMFPKLKNLLVLKNMAGGYLSIHYGLLPTISDLKEIYEAMVRRKPHIDKYGFTTSSSSFSCRSSLDNIENTLEQHAKIAVYDEDSDLLRLANGLESIGVFPTFENVWDLIPYSFVIDWFINIGDLLERVDTRLRLMRYEVKYTTLSRKLTRSVSIQPTPQTPYTGTVKKVSYKRWAPDQCPVPPLSLSTQLLSPSHWLEAGALIIQRAAK